MDTGTLVVAAVFVAICVLPFIFFGRGHRKLRKKFKLLLSQLAEKNGGKITAIETIGNFGIGIDENKNMAYFVRKTDEGILEKEVSLAEIKNCKLKTTTNYFEGGEKVVNSIDFEFFGNDAGKPAVIFNLYNADIDSSTLTGELQTAEKWERIFKGALKKSAQVIKSQVKSTAVV